MAQIQFAAQSYQSRSLPLDGQRCVNFFIEKAGDGAESDVGIFGCPGLTEFTTVGNGPIRGFREVLNVLYVVSGYSFYSVTSAGVATLLSGGTIIEGTAPVSMSDNGNQIMIVDGYGGFCYGIPGTAATNAGIFTDVSLVSGFYPSNTVTFMDGYFIFDRAGTTEFFLSGLLDGTSFNGLDFAAEEQIVSNIKAVWNLKDQLLIIAENNIQIWYDTGANDFPFQPYPGSLIHRGIKSSLAVTLEDNSIFFLADDGIMYRLNGLLPVRVSTSAIEAAWGAYSTIEDAECCVVVWEGHKFVSVTFPTAQATWHFDISTGTWHERESWDENSRSLGRWRGNCSIRAFDKVLIGDAFSNKIGYLDFDNFTEFGTTMRGYVTTPPIHRDRQRIFMSRFEVYMESGVGASSGQGVDPKVSLDWSDDGCRTWSELKRSISFGAQGQYQQRCRWLRLGQFRTRTLRLTVSDPVRRNIVGAYMDIT